MFLPQNTLFLVKNVYPGQCPNLDLNKTLLLLLYNFKKVGVCVACFAWTNVGIICMSQIRLPYINTTD